MTKHIDIIINGKGGVGKSFFATNFVQYLKDQQVEHRAIDTDNENSTLKRFHREAEFVNIEQVQEIDVLISSLEPTVWSSSIAALRRPTYFWITSPRYESSRFSKWSVQH